MELQLQKKISMELQNVNIHPGLPPPDISRIQPSFRIVASQGKQVSIRFYDLLFWNFPERQWFFHRSPIIYPCTPFADSFSVIKANAMWSRSVASISTWSWRLRNWPIAKVFPPEMYHSLSVCRCGTATRYCQFNSGLADWAAWKSQHPATNVTGFPLKLSVTPCGSTIDSASAFVKSKNS